jgi:hypothetical protein
LDSKNHIHKINVQEGIDGVIIEGNLGDLEKIILLEDSLLELSCTNGVLRFDVQRSELLQALHKEELSKSSPV